MLCGVCMARPSAVQNGWTDWDADSRGSINHVQDGGPDLLTKRGNYLMGFLANYYFTVVLQLFWNLSQPTVSKHWPTKKEWNSQLNDTKHTVRIVHSSITACQGEYYSNGSESLHYHWAWIIHLHCIFARCCVHVPPCFLGTWVCPSMTSQSVQLLFAELTTLTSRQIDKRTDTPCYVWMCSNSPHIALLAVLSMLADNRSGFLQARCHSCYPTNRSKHWST